jgi:hypothetical protein
MFRRALFYWLSALNTSTGGRFVRSSANCVRKRLFTLSSRRRTLRFHDAITIASPGTSTLVLVGGVLSAGNASEKTFIKLQTNLLKPIRWQIALGLPPKKRAPVRIVRFLPQQ